MGIHRESRRKNPKAKCLICEVKMDSRFGGKGRYSYCTDCASRYKRQLHNWWMRRAYNKRVGKIPERFSLEAILK